MARAHPHPRTHRVHDVSARGRHCRSGLVQPENKDGFLERVTRWNDALIADGYNAFDIKKEYGERPAFKSGIRHKAVGKKVTYNTTWSGYPAAGEATFTDGIGGGWSYGDGRWQGFLKAIDVVIDMDEVQDIHFVGGTFLCEPGPDIFLPKSVEVWLSEDGERFEQAAVIPNEIQEPSQSYVLFGTPVQGKARYIRFVAHPTRGFQFLDEIVVN